MAEEVRNIEYNITTRGVNETAYDFGRISEAAAGSAKTYQSAGSVIEKSSAASKLAIWGVGEQAEGLLTSLNVPHQMARKVGNSFEDMAAKLGTGAVAFGAVGIAVTAGISIWDHYQENQKKAREETLKAADAAGSWITQAAGEKGATDALTAAKEKLYKIEFERNKMNLGAGTEEQIKKVQDLYKAYHSAAQTAASTDIGAHLLFGTPEEHKRDLERAKLDYEQGVAELQGMYAKLDMYTDKVKNKTPETVGTAYAISDNWIDFQIQKQKEYYQKVKESGDLELEQLKARGADDFTIFAETWDNKLEYLRTSRASEYEINLAYWQMESDLEQKKREDAKKTAKLRSQMEQQTVDNYIDALQIMSDLGGKYGKAFFRVYQTASIGKTAMSGYTAATAALEPPPVGLGPVAGWGLAASIITLTTARVAQIASMKYDSGSSVSSSSTGSYDTGSTDTSTSTSSLPTTDSQSGGYGNLTIVLQDSTGKTTAELALDLAEELDKTGGTIGQYKFQMQRSA